MRNHEARRRSGKFFVMCAALLLGVGCMAAAGAEGLLYGEQTGCVAGGMTYAPAEEPAASAPTVYRVTYLDAFGGVFLTQDVAAGQAVLAPDTAPQRPGYRFAYWYNQAVGQEPFPFGHGAGEDLTLLPHYEEEPGGAAETVYISGEAEAPLPQEALPPVYPEDLLTYYAPTGILAAGEAQYASAPDIAPEDSGGLLYTPMEGAEEESLAALAQALEALTVPGAFVPAEEAPAPLSTHAPRRNINLAVYWASGDSDAPDSVTALVLDGVSPTLVSIRRENGWRAQADLSSAVRAEDCSLLHPGEYSVAAVEDGLLFTVAGALPAVETGLAALPPAPPPVSLSIAASRDGRMLGPDDAVYLGDTIHLIGEADILQSAACRLRWECDRGDGWRAMEGWSGWTQTFPLAEENRSWRFRLLLEADAA